MEKKINFTNSKGDNLVGILTATKKRDLIVIITHGFSSNKNTKNFVKLSKMLSKSKIASLRFDIWGHGESDGKLEDISISEAVDDALCAIKLVKKLGYKKIGLIGSSFSGISSIMAASKTSDLSFLILKSPVSDYWKLENERYTKKELTDWKIKGFILYEDDGIFKKINYSFVDDFKNNNAYKAAKKITISTLIVHGDFDKDVPHSQSKKLVSYLPNAKLITIKNANHRYTNKIHAKQMLKTIFDFISIHS